MEFEPVASETMEPANRDEAQPKQHDGYRRLLELTAGGPPEPAAIVHPCTPAALEAALAAAEAGLILPILIGPEAKIRHAAEQAGKNIALLTLVGAAHSHDAAEKAVALARSGEARLLIKGSLHTDELMGAVVAPEGLRTERRISHAFVMDVPGRRRPLIITDAAVNIAPTLEEKADIVRNAIDLAHVIGIERPRVALLAAIETVNPAMPATIDAAALCKMADRGQICGGILDGPLALDIAVSETAAQEKGIVSEVAGRAEILVVPNIEAGNMLAKELTFLGGADAAGVVLGARVPIVLPSRADSAISRLASSALGVLMARAATRAAPGVAGVLPR
jgi:phosphate acetyltransferase/phosphate butyryltransferase